MKSLRLLFVVSLFLFCTGFRSDGQERGGGDEIGLEFQTIATATLADIEKNNVFLFEQIKSQNLDQILNDMRILTVDSPLKITAGNVIQDSVAVNIPKDLLILVHRARWQALTDPRIKAGIVLHEILSLAGLEETGFYPISSRYVTSLGATSDGIKPAKDDDHTYLSCLDTNSSILLLSISPTYNLTAEIRALGAKNLESMRLFADSWGVADADQVVAVSFDIQAKALSPSTIGSFNDNCQLDLYNRALFDCRDGQRGSHSEQRKFVFKKKDGSSVIVDGESIAFWMKPSNTGLALHFVTERPKGWDRKTFEFGSGRILDFDLNSDSCR